jgi:hypothetical protein
MSMSMLVLMFIERYLRATKMPETKFGRLAVNDPRLVRDLRNGRELGPKVAERVATFIISGVTR